MRTCAQVLTQDRKCVRSYFHGKIIFPREALVELEWDPGTFPLTILQEAVSRNCRTQGRGRAE